jgi:hypothetical protein
MEKQYTAKQWSEIEGGHTMSEANQTSQYEFISDLAESRLYRTRQQLETADMRGVMDFAFITIVTLQILSSDPKTASIAQQYAIRTLANGTNFKQYRQSGSDLYQALHKIMSDPTVSNSVPEIQLKQYLRQMASGKPIASASNFLMRLERGLAINESQYKSMRRLGANWKELNTGQRGIVATRMIQFYRTHAIRSELYEPFKRYANSGGYVLQNIDNAETATISKRIAAKAAIGAAAFAGGFIAGRALGKSLWN